MRLGLALLPLAVLLAACRGDPSAPPTNAAPAVADAGVFRADAGVARLDAGAAGRPDAPAADATAPVDAGTSADAAPRPDASQPAVDAGTPPAPPCNEVTFTYADGVARTVWLTGGWTGWAATPVEGAVELMRGTGDTWSVTTRLDPGRHAYKLIVDGSRWLADPSAMEREPDGFGSFNSVVRVCEGGTLRVVTHSTDQASRRFRATLEYRGPADPAAAQVTVDLVPAAASAIQIRGGTIELDLTALTDGIHDVRVALAQDSLLLKVYINESTDWRDTVMYFAMTDRFVNGDPGNDAPVGGVLPGTDYEGGDFAGITGAIRQGYFEQLGVNALWVTWPTDNAEGSWEGLYPTGGSCNPQGWATGRFSAYHGYWPTSGRTIESRFGTMAELQTLVKEAHARGIRVLLDFTANHLHTQSSDYQANQSTWFNSPPVLCRDGHWDDHLREECWFEPYLADWNFQNADARKKVLDDAVWLARETGADGFRVDALKHMEDGFVRELRARVGRELELTGVPFYLVGETFTGDVGLINRYVGPQMVHGQFDFPSNKAIREALARNDIGVDEMHRRVRAIKAGYGAASGLMSTFIGNHDIARFISKATGELGCGIWAVTADRVRAFDTPPVQPTAADPYDRLVMALAYAYAVPGVPLLYYGDEVGLAGAGDPDNRRALPATSSLNGEQQRALQLVKKLGVARAGHAVLRTGDWTDALFGDTTALVFARTSPGEKALIVLNRGDQRTIDVQVGAAGLPDGATLDAKIGAGTVTVRGGRVSLPMPRLSVEIYVTR